MRGKLSEMEKWGFRLLALGVGGCIGALAVIAAAMVAFGLGLVDFGSPPRLLFVGLGVAFFAIPPGGVLLLVGQQRRFDREGP